MVTKKNASAGGQSMSATPQKKGRSAKIATKKGGRKYKQILRKLPDIFNYEQEPSSINTKGWYDGHP